MTRLTLLLLAQAAVLVACAPAVDDEGDVSASLSLDQTERPLINQDNGVINNTQLSYRSAIELAVSVGIACGADAITMTAIARQESTFRVGIVGPENDNGTFDYGVWQINSGTAAEQGFRTAQLLQPLINAEAMVAVRDSQGLDAWSAYKFGRYKKYVKYAQEAFNTYGCE
jgi:hypothetical protein